MPADERAVDLPEGVTPLRADGASKTLPATVEISADVALEAIAAFHALDNYFGHLREMRFRWADDGNQSQSALGDWCIGQADALQEAAFGAVPGGPDDDDDAWHTWTPEVERYARGTEKTAELLTLHVRVETEIAQDLAEYSVSDRPQRELERAAKIREAGSIDV